MILYALVMYAFGALIALFSCFGVLCFGVSLLYALVFLYSMLWYFGLFVICSGASMLWCFYALMFLCFGVLYFGFFILCFGVSMFWCFGLFTLCFGALVLWCFGAMYRFSLGSIIH